MPDVTLRKTALSFAFAATAVFLSACGGSGDDAGSQPVPGGPGQGQPPGGGGATTQLSIYEALPLPSGISAADFLSQINGEGSRSFRFFSGLVFGNGAEQVAAYVKDATTTYTFELQPDARSSSALTSQLQAQGARGFRFAGPYVVGSTFYNLYRKDAGSAATYAYTVLPAAASSIDFLAQANAQGVTGYYAAGATLMLGTSTVQLYERASPGTATYAYEAQPNPANDADFLAQLNEEGTRGYRFRTAFVFTDGTKLVYEKDTSQAATFGYADIAPQTTSNAYITQANAQGAAGFVLIGDYVLPSRTIRTLFAKPANCSGILCVTRGPFGY